MKQISIWAKQYVFAARISIFIIHVLLIFNAFFLCKNIHYKISFFELKLIAATLISSSVIYSYLKTKSYLFQRIIIFITSICFFLIICFFIQRNFSLPYYQKAVSAISLSVHNVNKQPTAQEILESLKYRDKNTLTKQEKRILKKELKNQLNIYTKATLENDTEKQSHALVIILTVIAAVGLIFALSLLACSVACGGSGALAIIIFAVGTFGIIFGAAAIINKAKGKRIKSNFRTTN